MSKSGLIGATGFVGSNLLRQTSFDFCYNRQTIEQIRGEEFDRLVCAAPQAKKWWANQHPEADKHSILELIAHLNTVHTHTFILISSIDVFPVICGVDESYDCHQQNNHPYGQNRLFLEEAVRDRFPSTYVLRLPGLFGKGLKKNVIYDLLTHNQLEKLHPNSQFQWYDLSRLWQDVQAVLAASLPLVVLATEPVRTDAIQQRFFAETAIGAEATDPVSYDIHTQYAQSLGGQGNYLCSTEQVLEQIGTFVMTERGRQ